MHGHLRGKFQHNYQDCRWYVTETNASIYYTAEVKFSRRLSCQQTPLTIAAIT